jgi:hypothetical protein
MRFQTGNNLFELVVLERVPEQLPTPGDTKFAISIQSANFCGRGTTWINRPSLEKFAIQLTELEATRNGRAEVHSMSPSQFYLVIETIDGWGHTGVSGRLSQRKNAVEFAFEFEPDQLPDFAAELRHLATVT